MIKLLALVLLTFNAWADSYSEVEVMRLDLRPSGSRVVYKASFNQARCEFVPGAAPSFYREVSTPIGKWQQEQNFLDRLYFGIKTQSITAEKLRLVLNSAKNIELLAIPVKVGGDCVIRKLMNDGTEPREISSIEISLDNTFGIPILNEVVISGQERIKPDTDKLMPWDLSGYFPIYEASLGMGFNLHSNIYKENDKRYWRTDPALEPVPLFMLRVGPFFLNKDGAGALLLPYEKATLLATFLIDGEPFRATGFKERKKSVYGGFIFKSGDFYVQYFKDVGDVSQGWVVNFAWNPEWEINTRYKISPRVVAQRWDGDYADYYFGVEPGETTRLGGPFSAGATWNGLFTVSQTYRWGRIQGLLVTELKVYGSDVLASPLTKQRSEFRLISGLLYNLF